MSILSKDPRGIHPAYKEAVVDSLLNGLSARLAGRGDFYKIVYSTKPSAVLMSEFIMPVPAEERESDEEADPIRISAHGMDFQINAAAGDERLEVSLTGAVYVRILPQESEVQPGGKLEATFPLTRDARREIRTKVKEGLAKLATELAHGKSDPEWGAKSYDVRKKVYESMGLTFDNRLDLTPANGEAEVEFVETEDRISIIEDESPVQEVLTNLSTPDILTDDIPPPAKWLRLDLTLPSFEFRPSSAAEDARIATNVLNESIVRQLSDWAASNTAGTGGMLWGYRRTRIRPSDVRDWNGYLERVRTSSLPVIVPHLELRWIIQAVPDPVHPSRLTVHVALENWTNLPTVNNFNEIEPSFFQVSVSTTIPTTAHRYMYLDRVKPSYRYNQYLKYPALGFNGGVTMLAGESKLRLTTTWAPRYVLPRIIPTDRPVELDFEKLSQPDCITGLKPIIQAYEAWLTKVEKEAVGQKGVGLNTPEQLAAEEDKFQLDITKWQSELNAIRCGLDILEKSRENWSGPGKQTSPLGIPFEAWLSMNKSMLKVAKLKGYNEWRLFQLSFILASIPAFATRIPEFHSFYTPEVARHANAVTLLYFSTGGGKSEAFLGLLTFVLFLDRLRGKHRGVSALMRYPLRLLTLQQARRTFATIGAAEEVRHIRGLPGEPFSLGFWVGSSNTPNWHSGDGYNDVPRDDEVAIDIESEYKNVPTYKSARERWLKLTSCPFCGNKEGSLLALRRHSGKGANAMGHYCSGSKENCSWNARFNKPTPLPFYIVDEDIYDLAPTVLLGTVDKLAAIGQSQGTIRKFFGMFGFAPLLRVDSERLYIPLKQRDWDTRENAETRPLFPSFTSGEKRFFDPFPALLIQDEAHLLDESLGTFSGLFESALEAAFDQLSPLFKDYLSYEPKSMVRRKIKIVAASATVNEPQRQMRNLYQRESTVQFPYPGPTLYDSFYATPFQPDNTSYDSERSAIPEADIELRSHWARVYSSLLTNGHRHTVAMASVLGHYHVMLTGLYERLRSEEPSQEDEARNELIQWVTQGPLQAQFVRLLKSVDVPTLLTLIDLHRIALTYVTNKKGGDQVIDTERGQFTALHHSAGYPAQSLNSELISGAVSAADIQDIVRRAESRTGVNNPFPDLNDTLRSVIATSAISHGVDVEEFNAMFFAGIPSDIAEYIQASSRVGRTHVGFSLLVPVPQRHRDRFVLEIHDIFHRFLERMILPAAIDRWAEKALVRVMPSFFQEYVCGINAIERLCAVDDDNKRNSSTFAWASDVRDFLQIPDNIKSVATFMEKALGLHFSPSPKGKHYYLSLLKQELNHYRQDLNIERLVNGTRLLQFFEERNNLMRPMTSLRDVDQPGIIRESTFDAFNKRVSDGTTARAMTFIRKGSGADID